MKVGKTKLTKKIKNAVEPEERPNRIIAGKTKLVSKAQKLKQNQKQNEISPSQLLIEKIAFTYFTDCWQKKIKSIETSSNRPNKKRRDFKIFMSKVTQAFTYHQYLYLMELFNKMSSLPTKPGVTHDPNYGKISIYTQEKPKKNRIPGKRNPKKTAELENYENENGNENEDVVIEGEVEEKEEPNMKIRGQPKKIKNVDLEYKKNEENEEEDEDDIRYNTIEIERQKICGSCINRKEVQENIRKLMEQNPDKDIDVERIMRSKRLQYKMRNPWTNPIINKFYVCDYVRKVDTYKGRKSKELENDRQSFVNHKSKMYTDNLAGDNWQSKKIKNTDNYYENYYNDE